MNTKRDYLRENIYVTTSGMAWEPAVTFIQSVLGMDRVLAMDYPCQFVPEEVEAMDALPRSNEDRRDSISSMPNTYFHYSG